MSTPAALTVYVVYSPGAGEAEFPRENEAAADALARPGAKVIRVEREGRSEARQRIWPTVGPVYRKAG